MSAGTACGGSMLAVRSVVRNSVRGLWFRPAVARSHFCSEFLQVVASADQPSQMPQQQSSLKEEK